jgi:hypothetical protein
VTSVPKRLLVALLVIEYAGIAWLVLNPSPATPSSAVAALSEAMFWLGFPTWLADGTVVEFWLNVILFVPLGALSALIWPRVRLWGWVLAGFLLSSTLEWLQLQLLSERSSTSRDIVANTLGMALGAGLVWTVRWLRFTPDGQSHAQARAHSSGSSR